MWLIALVVPIQGSAAVTMYGCGPGHHGGKGSSQAAMSQELAPNVDDPSRGAMTEDADSHHHHHDGDAALGQPRTLMPHGATHKVAKGNCTPCASCCVVAALPATVIQFEPVSPVDFFALPAQTSVSSFLTDGLERPPRLFLA
jgi:hypothetical protein